MLYTIHRKKIQKIPQFKITPRTRAESIQTSLKTSFPTEHVAPALVYSGEETAEDGCGKLTANHPVTRQFKN
jgi:hypothetical protein